jgi:phage terminase large subunit-like protein
MKYNGTKKGHKYAVDVVAGKVVACKWIVIACQKYLDDLKKSSKRNFKYEFDEKAAERVLMFKQMMPHTKGKWAQQRLTLKLEPWQCFFNMNIFGWKSKKTGFRRYRKALLIVPRKNGKSAEAATTGLYMLSSDDEYGAEVYSGATTEKQAWEVFRPAKLMATRAEGFIEATGAEVNASNINILENGSRFEPIIGNPGDGQSPSCAIIDEYHEHKDDKVLDTMETGMGAREQPLLLVITTAGDNIAGPCYQMQIDAQKALEGVIESEQTFALIYTVDKGDDWASIEALKKANPNFGVSVSEEFLLARLQDAKNNARKQSVYKTKHLNIWVGSRDAFFNIERWNESADNTLKIEDFYGKKAYIAMDLASKVDIAAVEILIDNDGELVRFGKYYLPEAALEATASDHYAGWAKDGWLTITDGEIIDFSEIEADILDLCGKFQVDQLAYDPFQATMLATRLMAEGVPIIEIGATVKNFSEPMKQLDGLVRSRQITHNGDPVMTWMMSNVVAKVDAKDNVFPRKEKDEYKIDGPVALIMALNRQMNDDIGSLDSFLNDPIGVDY